jgi:vacuolar-type H+-ATPase subunit H
MKEIDNMIKQAKSDRDAKLKDTHQRMEKLMKEPLDKFEKDYKGSIQNLSAKEGLGKTYGQPRRLA